MKIIKKDVLDVLMYADRKKEHPLLSNPTDQFSIRSFLKNGIDAPVKDKVLDRKRLKSINSVYEALDTDGDLILEDSDFTFLKNHVEIDMRIGAAYIFETLMSALDSAKDAKVKVEEKTKEDQA